MVTTAISQTIAKTTYMKFNEQNLRDLRRRTVQLDELVKQVHSTVRNTPVFVQHGARMADVLRELAGELEQQTARQPNRILRFLSSPQDALALQQRMYALDRIISDLLIIISLDTSDMMREVLQRSSSQATSITATVLGENSSGSSASAAPVLSRGASDTSRLTVLKKTISGRGHSLTDASDSGASSSGSVLQVSTAPLKRSRSFDSSRPLYS